MIVRVRSFSFSFVVAGALLACACSRRGPTATAEGTVREVFDRLRRMQIDPADAKLVVPLLSRRARANLAGRAERFTAKSGKPIALEAMLVPYRVVVRFEPQRYLAHVYGDAAVVEVMGTRPSDRAEIPCVREEGVWKIDLSLPPLPPLQTRGTTDRR